ncbi:MAG: Rhomboid family protein [Bacteroidetes bacterium]|uniref:rhomboid family intramembrane serine protease n=1 Tax=Chitinophaga sp. LS1 TaxID=3051176 RepID=UPI001D79321D|nr:rhomboid family intramembrane serine protease [Chitinophaga sp. LS1]MBP1650614.1 Rhomboid family protein [Bacteroidota bacterium]WPV67214.1 rhomboid family intramembrane serine protease [Chitinophaga sp. LS1]
MGTIGLTCLLIIIVNIIVSFKGFRDPSFFARYAFDVDGILLYRQYDRIISAGFLHANKTHLFLNMLALFFFSTSLEYFLSNEAYLTIYLASLIGGNLLSLFLHRHHGDYTAIGASGAVSGIIFASIAIEPGVHIGLLFLPFHVPGWLFGICYVLYSIYGIRSQRDNIGHDAHLGGAMVGMLTALLFQPLAVIYNYGTILLILLPGIFFIYMVIRHPHLLLVDNLYFKRHHKGDLTIEDRYNSAKVIREQEIDGLLEKIHRNGLRSLTKKERKILEDNSKL